ncbi:MAG: GAF domain-containing protein [Desulfobacterales bacterium]|nr:GAF domain-containing protein [Desulfobacterales bacterium]
MKAPLVSRQEMGKPYLKSKKSKMSTRLFMGLGIILLLNVVLTMISILKLSEFPAFTRDNIAYLLRINGKVHSIQIYLYDIGDYVNELVSSYKPELSDSLIRKISDQEKRIETSINFSSDFQIPASMRDGLKGRFNELKNYYQNILEVIGKDDTDKIKMYHEKHQEAQKKMDLQLREIIEGVQKLFITDVEFIKRDAVFIVLMLMLITFFTGILVLLFISKSIVKPINHLIRISRHISGGVRVPKQEIKYYDEIGQLIESFNTIIDSNNSIVEQAQAISSGNYDIEIHLRSQNDELGIALQKMTESLQKTKYENELQNRIKTCQNEVNECMYGEQDIGNLSKNVLTYLATFIHAQVGAIYLVNDTADLIELVDTYALVKTDALRTSLRIGEGVVGQVALENKMIRIIDVPQDYFTRISFTFGEGVPKDLIVFPFSYEKKVVGVIELGSLTTFSDAEIRFLQVGMDHIAVTFSSAIARNKMQKLLISISSELRTPLNKLLLSSQDMLKNQQGNLTCNDIESIEKMKLYEEELLKLIEDLSRLVDSHEF